MDGIEIEMQGFQELQAAWQQAPQIVQEELEAAMIEADALIEREVKELTPTAHGLLRQSITSEEQVNAMSVIGVVGTSLDYAVPVELGTKPHFPPIEPLIDWVIVKLGVPEKQARGVAFLIARKISRVGTEGAHMFTLAFTQLEAQINQIFQAAADRIAARLTGGAPA